MKSSEYLEKHPRFLDHRPEMPSPGMILFLSSVAIGIGYLITHL